jgi:hypothetical protein
MKKEEDLTDRNGAGARAPIVSTWRLVSHKQEDMETGEVTYPRGPNPRGLATYTDDGRFSILNVPGEREAPKGLSPTDAEALALFKGLTAYAGRYSITGPDSLIHHTEIAWNESWANTDQPRRFKVEGDILTLIAGPSNNPWDGRVVRATLTWKRITPD